MSFGLASLPPLFRADFERVLASGSISRLGLLLYGSVARGTATICSDIDLLELVPANARSYSIGLVNVAQYTPASLRALSSQGNLFMQHLVQEGRVLEDEHKILRRIIGAHVQIDALTELRADVLAVSGVLDVENLAIEPSGREINSIARLGLYLLRSALYLHRSQSGPIRFDLAGADVPSGLAMRKQKSFSRSDIAIIRNQLFGLLGEEKINPYGTIELYAILEGKTVGQAALLSRVIDGSRSFEYSSLGAA